MKKMLLIASLILLVFLTGCGSPCRDMQACVMGCVAGFMYNGTDYVTIEVMDNTTIHNIQACQKFCDTYFDVEYDQTDLFNDEDFEAVRNLQVGQ